VPVPMSARFCRITNPITPAGAAPTGTHHDAHHQARRAENSFVSGR
jgi:hypothetical protein